MPYHRTTPGRDCRLHQSWSGKALETVRSNHLEQIESIPRFCKTGTRYLQSKAVQMIARPCLIPRTRFERVTPSLGGKCSIQLSYRSEVSVMIGDSEPVRQHPKRRWVIVEHRIHNRHDSNFTGALLRTDSNHHLALGMAIAYVLHRFRRLLQRIAPIYDRAQLAGSDQV